MDSFIGEIRVFGFTFVPMDWAQCNGSSLPVSQYSALYSILGNQYGGNTSNFNLPNLQGRIPMGAGTGPGLTPRQINDAVGSMTVTLLESELPYHNHSLNAQASSDSTKRVGTPPAGGFITIPATLDTATPPKATNMKGFAADSTVNTTLSWNVVGQSGSGQPHANTQPYLTALFCISLAGVYPVKP